MWKGNSLNHFSNKNQPDSAVPLSYTHILHASRVLMRRAGQSNLQRVQQICDELFELILNSCFFAFAAILKCVTQKH